MRMDSTDEVSMMMKKVQEALDDLFNEYKRNSQTYSENVGESSQVSQVTESTTEIGVSQKKRCIKSEYKRYKVEHGKEENKLELARYFSEQTEDDDDDDEDFDVLIWWKLNSHRFPILSNIARDELATPISTVTSESAFSIGGRILDAYRSSLTPKIVQALICAQD